MNAPRQNPSHAGWYSIYLPRRDGRLSWLFKVNNIFSWFVSSQNCTHSGLCSVCDCTVMLGSGQLLSPVYTDVEIDKKSTAINCRLLLRRQCGPAIRAPCYPTSRLDLHNCIVFGKGTDPISLPILLFFLLLFFVLLGWDPSSQSSLCPWGLPLSTLIRLAYSPVIQWIFMQFNSDT